MQAYTEGLQHELRSAEGSKLSAALLVCLPSQVYARRFTRSGPYTVLSIDFSLETHLSALLTLSLDTLHSTQSSLHTLQLKTAQL